MSKKSGLVRRFFFFVLFLIGVFLLVLLIKYDWNVDEVFGYIINLLGGK